MMNQGKAAVKTSSQQQQQLQGSSPGMAGTLGSKGMGPGGHLTTKGAAPGALRVGKGRGKRERSESLESRDQRETNASNAESDCKDMVSRGKRKCVLEKKTPYSGDEWCSGPDSDADDKPFLAASAAPTQPERHPRNGTRPRGRPPRRRWSDEIGSCAAARIIITSLDRERWRRFGEATVQHRIDHGSR
uniref:B-cell CLL/lymphoma 9-like protein n=1 Tax=Petromyzon marinus TaxID=7757 RepID=A0AAJ7TM02_PETMA|nr:B-cell CLL/lymphoma 9-like protein [Petromyzon marinus]